MDGADRFKADLAALLPRLRRFGRTLTGSADAADELVQSACERALLRYHQWTPGSRLDSWVFSIMRSIWKNDLRSKRIRSGAGIVDPDTESRDDGRQTIEARLLLREVERAIEALPEGQRAALLLVGVEGYRYKEAAEILDIPIGTLTSRLARARLALGKKFEREANDTTGRTKGSAQGRH